MHVWTPPLMQTWKTPQIIPMVSCFLNGRIGICFKRLPLFLPRGLNLAAGGVQPHGSGVPVAAEQPGRSGALPPGARRQAQGRDHASQLTPAAA